MVSPKDMLTVSNDRGTTTLEYGVMAALLAITCLLAMGFVGGEVDRTFDTAGKEIYFAAGGNVIDPGDPLGKP